jgi:hypothetical protein
MIDQEFNLDRRATVERLSNRTPYSRDDIEDALDDYEKTLDDALKLDHETLAKMFTSLFTVSYSFLEAVEIGNQAETNSVFLNLHQAVEQIIASEFSDTFRLAEKE